MGVLGLAGCSPSMDDYKKTVRDGIKNVPYMNEIEKIFPNQPTDYFITQYGFNMNVPVTWNAEVFFAGRYVFTYQVEVLVDYKRDRIIKTSSPPHFTLVQVSRVYDDTPENIGADFDADHKFGEAEWKRVIAADGDFSVIGILIDTNHPVPRFDDYVRATRRDRIQVR